MSATHTAEQLAGGRFVSGQGATVQSLNAMAAEIAKTDIPVLLVGESGTGKEIYARLIHQLSRFGETPLKKVNCGALDVEQVLAQVRGEVLPSRRSGGAAGQTVFLDGVDELDLARQRVLLSLLPDGEQKNQGSQTVLRFISSTSCNLEREIEAGRFRRELYFRINGATLRLPPLRERKEDIPALMKYFLLKHSDEFRKAMPELAADAWKLLDSYGWPGNIRELENIAKKIVAVGEASRALGDLCRTRECLPAAGESFRKTALKVVSRAAARHAERELILKALEQTHWNRKRAARELQISYKSLLYKIKQIGVEDVSCSEKA
jgi:two-component system, NtrC family, response regulator AtoC